MYLDSDLTLPPTGLSKFLQSHILEGETCGIYGVYGRTLCSSGIRCTVTSIYLSFINVITKTNIEHPDFTYSTRGAKLTGKGRGEGVILSKLQVVNWGSPGTSGMYDSFWNLYVYLGEFRDNEMNSGVANGDGEDILMSLVSPSVKTSSLDERDIGIEDEGRGIGISGERDGRGWLEGYLRHREWRGKYWNEILRVLAL